MGRSLDALLGSVGRHADASHAAEPELREIAVDSLQPGRHQPRRRFDEQALAELASSIATQGVVQPIVVRFVGPERFEIVAGERRWRAAQLAGLKTIPAVIRSLDDRGAMAVALVENIQRADLNPLEEAVALHKLIEDCHLTHEQVAEAVGRSRAAVTNLLRIMDLNPDVQEFVRQGQLSLGHAKVLLGTTGSSQSDLARKAVDRQLSVRQLEVLIKSGQEAARPKEKAPAQETVELEKRIADDLGLPIRLQVDSKGRSQILIKCRNARELDEFVLRISASRKGLEE
jgi:ParB family transcriptional regulator, chromosome partitioning protein